MAENFSDLFSESLKKDTMQVGSVIPATIVRVEKDYVIVDTHFKSEGVVPVEEFFNEEGVVGVSEGDVVDVVLIELDNSFGETRVSREKAKRAAAWTKLEKAHETNATITGMISGKVKGGFTVDIDNSIRAFLPGSLVDIRPVRDMSYLENKELEFKVIKMDMKRNNVVVSRRAVVQEEGGAERGILLETLNEGAIAKGVVKNLTDYGAFIDLGGIDGLLHITDMSWKRIRHSSEMINVGDEITVMILKFDKDRNRVSLGLKQLGDDPWINITKRYPPGTHMSGKVTNITDYGCFVEIQDGVEGLVHVSEMSWTNKNIHPSKVVQLGQEVNVLVLEIDEDRRRISLGIKQCKQNPWQDFSEKYKEGDLVKGAIKSVTDFGIFIGLEGEIDGLIHLNDISWTEPGERAIRHFSKGDEVEAVVLSVDPDRERISLGIKQLQGDPFNSFVEAHPKGTIVHGSVKAVDQKGVTVSLTDSIDGYIRVSEIAFERIKDATEHFKEGEQVKAAVTGIDKKARMISLSIKAMLKESEGSSDAGAADVKSTFGDLLKEQMDNKDN